MRHVGVISELRYESTVLRVSEEVLERLVLRVIGGDALPS